jgi:pimeloyl-ACP methyl ester carboxylesterase
MPYATNPIDGRSMYFEDDGGDGVPVLFHGGLLDCTDDVRESGVAQGLPRDEFRHVYADHRGLGRSDKPHDPSAYSMPIRAADAIAVLDALALERAHFVGMSWGGRLGVGIGEHAPERVLSLVVGGQQPYAWPDSPITRAVTEGLAACHGDDAEPLVEAFERFWDVLFPEPRRARWVDNDPKALAAAWSTVIAEGPVSADLTSWRLPCLFFLGAGDADFLDQARQAAGEIPTAELVVLEEADHYAAHVAEDEILLKAVLRMLRANS